jgi:HEAT repeats
MWTTLPIMLLLVAALPPQPNAATPKAFQGDKMTPSQIVERVKQKDWGVLEQPGIVGADAGPALLPLLGDSDPQVRALAVACLNAAGGAAARQGLIKALHDRIETVRAAAARYLHEHYAKEDIPVIQRELTASPDEYVREQLALLLGKTGDDSNIKLLLARIPVEKDEHARHAASLALARLGEATHRHHLIERLKQDDPKERVNALKDLPYVNDRSLLAHVIPLLDDTRPGLNVGPAHGRYFLRVCDVAVNVANEMLDKPFPWVEPVKRYSPEQLSEAKAALAAV